MKIKSAIIASLETSKTYNHLANLLSDSDTIEYIDWIYDNIIRMDLTGYDYPVNTGDELLGLIEDMYIMFTYDELNYTEAIKKMENNQ